MGLIGTLNRGLGLARGEFIARMDSDDIAMPIRFAEQLKFFKKNPDVSLVGSWLEVFQGREHIHEYPTKIGIWELYLGNPIAHNTVMWRRKDLERYDLRYDPDYVAAEDYELWARAASYVKIANIDKVLCKYRWHSENVSSTMAEIQMKNTERISQTLLDSITPDPVWQERIRMMQKRKRRIWLGIPLFKVKPNALHLFDVIPLLRVRKGRWRLFESIPLFKSKYE
jgi:glycosyltransferase involved in cell wall biosynthesis